MMSVLRLSEVSILANAGLIAAFFKVCLRESVRVKGGGAVMAVVCVCVTFICATSAGLSSSCL